MNKIPAPDEKASNPDAELAQWFLADCVAAVDRIPERLAAEARKLRALDAIMQAAGCPMREFATAADVAEQVATGEIGSRDALAAVKAIEKRLPVMRAAGCGSTSPPVRSGSLRASAHTVGPRVASPVAAKDET